MQRLPSNLITNKLLTTTLTDTAYVVPENSTLTVSALSFNNTTGTARLVTAHAFPSGGSATASNQILTSLSVPISGAQPTSVPSLVGQHFPAGTTIEFKDDAGSAVAINLSGYLTTP